MDAFVPLSTDAYKRCDFETGLCSWEQLTTDEADWVRVKGSSVSLDDHTTDSQDGEFNPRDLALIFIQMQTMSLKTDGFVQNLAKI